jgi:hypothetical protein
MSNTIHPLKIDLLKIPGAKKFQSKDGTWHVAIPHPAVYIGEKGAYLDCDLTEKKNGKDNYENTHSIAMRQTKEQRQAREPRVFIGDGKTITFGSTQQSAPAKKDDSWIDSTDDNSEIPF